MTAPVQLSVAPPVDRPAVGLCAGKACCKRGASVEVRDVLERECDVIDLRCVGLCSGPVVVIDPASSKPAVYSKLRTKKHRALLIELVAGDARARKQLADRRVSKKKVVAAVTRQLRRRRGETRRAA